MENKILMKKATYSNKINNAFSQFFKVCLNFENIQKVQMIEIDVKFKTCEYNNKQSKHKKINHWRDK